MRLWLVEIHEDDFEYDCFVSGVVRETSAARAKKLIMECGKLPTGHRDHVYLPRGESTRLTATEVKQDGRLGVVHQHWHAG